MTEIVLKDVDLNSAGTYKCEILADLSFEQVTSNATMEVVGEYNFIYRVCVK